MKYIFLVALIIMTVACNGPDLSPVESKPAYCNIDNGNLVVFIANIGNEDCDTTYTDVSFGSYGVTSVMTSPIPAGANTHIIVPLPVGCFDPDCGFEIKVDARDTVDEKNESNNSAIGNCIG